MPKKTFTPEQMVAKLPAPIATPHSALHPGISRFSARQQEDEDEAELWRGNCQPFRNLWVSEPGNSLPGFRFGEALCVCSAAGRSSFGGAAVHLRHGIEPPVKIFGVLDAFPLVAVTHPAK